MHSHGTVRAALELSAQGLSATAVALELGIPRRTVADWLSGSPPGRSTPPTGTCERCRAVHELDRLGSDYVYLLGLYLGDGCLSRLPRDVYKLRIFLDARYPQIIDRTSAAIEVVARRTPGRIVRNETWVEVYSAWRAWPCLFPQHGRGKKHERAIALTSWQQHFVARSPRELVRGLIESDGCRFANAGRGGWSAPRYAFKNRSADIHGIFRHGCEHLGVRWTASGDDTTYVSRQADVALLDQFIGPKR